MRIAIDISQVIYGTGVSVYTSELVENLVKFNPNESFIFFGGSIRRQGELREFANKFKKVKSVITPISPSVADLIWNRIHVFPIELFVGKVDVFHSSDWAEPPSRCFKVTTIHDLSPLVMPKFAPQKVVEIHQRKFEWIKKEVDRVIVPSISTKKDAVKLGLKEEKVRVIPEALREGFGSASQKEVVKVKNKYRISGIYALAVGTNPRKNTPRIIDAYNTSKEKAGLSNLVVVGEHDRKKGNSDVLFTGKVAEEDLKALYTGAALLIYTSLYEGFGLPILEAFSCGCPVLTSNISSMPEVAGDAAVQVNPFKVEDIANGIVKTLKDSEKLIVSGKERVKNYSWDFVARKTMDVYKELER